MSAKVSPASAIAASHASMVSDSGGTINRRPIFEMPIPVRADLSSNFSVVSMGRTCSAKRSGAISSAGRERRSASAIGRNRGNHTSSTCSKTTSTCWPSSSASKSLGSAPHDVGGQPHAGIFRDRHLGDHVRRRQPRQAEPFVDREAGERRLTGERPAHRCRGSGSSGTPAPADGSARRRPGIPGTASVPSAPDVQKNSFSCVIRGSGRSGAAAVNG